MTRSPLVLAALATAAVPGLEPVSTWGPPSAPGDRYDLAFLTDDRQRQWVVRAPRTPADGAVLDASQVLLRLVGRRLPFKVPAPAGFANLPEGRAMAYPMLPGKPIDLTKVPPGVGLATALGRALAAIHNLDRAVYDEAGMPTYDSEEYRQRRLAELDRAAATGHVPTGLLARWEKALEDITLWRFAPTPVHGSLTGDRILVSFTDPDDVATGTVTGVTGWETAKVADPADDWAAIVAECPPDVVEDVRDGYRSALIERADPHLIVRAHLAGELSLMRRLLTADVGGDAHLAQAHASTLRRLDQFLAATGDDALSQHVYREDLTEPWATGARASGPALELDGPDAADRSPGREPAAGTAPEPDRVAADDLGSTQPMDFGHAGAETNAAVADDVPLNGGDDRNGTEAHDGPDERQRL